MTSKCLPAVGIQAQVVKDAVLTGFAVCCAMWWLPCNLQTDEGDAEEDKEAEEGAGADEGAAAGAGTSANTGNRWSFLCG